MNRRTFITSLLGGLASLAFIGKAPAAGDQQETVDLKWVKAWRTDGEHVYAEAMFRVNGGPWRRARRKLTRPHTPVMLTDRIGVVMGESLWCPA